MLQQSVGVYLPADDPDVAGSLTAPARIDLDLELEILSFRKGIKDAGWQR
jgi:hypothetical protein